MQSRAQFSNTSAQARIWNVESKDQLSAIRQLVEDAAANHYCNVETLDGPVHRHNNANHCHVVLVESCRLKWDRNVIFLVDLSLLTWLYKENIIVFVEGF